MRYSRILAIAAAFSLISCVGTKKFTIHTTPEGAEVTLNGQKLPGVTPMTIEIDQDKDLGFVVRKKGYQVSSESVQTVRHNLLSIIWTNHDPRARYIPQDDITIPLTPIPTAANYVPGKMPAYAPSGTPAPAQAPELRPLPAGLVD